MRDVGAGLRSDARRVPACPPACVPACNRLIDRLIPYPLLLARRPSEPSIFLSKQHAWGGALRRFHAPWAKTHASFKNDGRVGHGKKRCFESVPKEEEGKGSLFGFWFAPSGSTRSLNSVPRSQRVRFGACPLLSRAHDAACHAHARASLVLLPEEFKKQPSSAHAVALRADTKR